ncbi:hypothetical protein BDFB_015206 [Asbolus verrucosus]|uniref:Uncharacterized protein n=1 Tax=Asbolus verrucosus TaxID=1661398 RepID=A0A482VVW1_ASBVE|nr:hypothetical protein BDFB_015206 [Asbolus verrucosus]
MKTHTIRLLLLILILVIAVTKEAYLIPHSNFLIFVRRISMIFWSACL